MATMKLLCAGGVALILLLFNALAMADLSADYYAKTCPKVASLVRKTVYSAIKTEARMGASLLRLHFHDCFVQGCDASILLDDTSSFEGEKNAGPNANSVRGYGVIDDAKTAVESACPGVVSCADILALAARDSVVKLGGPTWSVPLGRRDSTTASKQSANTDLPAPFENVSVIVTKFSNKGLSTIDMVALSGAHTIGDSRCIQFRDRLYNYSNTAQPDPNLNTEYLASLQSSCPRSGGDDNLSPMDYRTSTVFDKKYFTNMLRNRSLLNSDQELYYTPGTTNILVKSYSHSKSLFFSDFTSAMIKMSKIKPLTGTEGEIRTKCGSINS